MIELAVAVEVKLGSEGAEGVNFEVITWTVVIVGKVVLVVLPAGAGSVAVVVVTSARWGVAGVWGGLSSPLISLHNIELWAVVTTNLVGVTVVHTVFRWVV